MKKWIAESFNLSVLELYLVHKIRTLDKKNNEEAVDRDVDLEEYNDCSQIRKAILSFFFSFF